MDTVLLLLGATLIPMGPSSTIIILYYVSMLLFNRLSVIQISFVCHELHEYLGQNCHTWINVTYSVLSLPVLFDD